MIPISKVLSVGLISLQVFALELPQDSMGIPITPQQTNYSCGAASIKATLTYWTSFNGAERSLYRELKTQKKTGTDSAEMAGYLKKNNFEVVEGLNQTVANLRDLAAKGFTIIMNLQAWAKTPPADWSTVTDDGHYLLYVGSDSENIYVMDPSLADSYGYIPLSELQSRWHDGGESGYLLAAKLSTAPTGAVDLNLFRTKIERVE